MLGLIFLVLSAAIQSECEETVVKVIRVKPVGPEVPVEPGQDVTLPCLTDVITIRAAEWTRSDLVYPDYVLLYRDGLSDPEHQHSSFKGRVQLVDGELKNGDVSLILKNVSREDNGTYECRVLTAGSRRNKRAIIKTEPISIIQLQVTEPEVLMGRVGQDVILPCQTGDVNIIVAEWTRSEPQPPKDILLWRDGHSDTPFKGRVYLVNSELKTRNVSLILKDVRREDVGTYECRVKTAGSRRKKTEPISIVRLLVTDSETVVVQVGQKVILPCQAGDVTITAVEWTRSDLEDPDYVLYYSDGHSDPTFQHSNFTDRVQLVDRNLKNGNVSLILKNVRREDEGTYECRVLTAGSRRKKTISFFQLQVTEDQKGDNNKEDNNINTTNNNGDIMGIFTPHHGGLGAAAGVLLLVCLVSAAVGLFLVCKPRRQRENKSELSADEETGGDNSSELDLIS